VSNGFVYFETNGVVKMTKPLVAEINQPTSGFQELNTTSKIKHTSRLLVLT
jgi:hypothetical protein